MKLQEYWKAILAFASTTVVPGIVMWIQSGQPWPHDTNGWFLWAATILGSTATVAAGPANAPSAGKHEAPDGV